MMFVKYVMAMFLTLGSCLSVCAQRSSDEVVKAAEMKAAVVVEGLFFDKSVPAKSVIPGGSTMVVLKDPEGAMVIGAYLPEGYALEESIMKRAIPAERVKFAEKLMRDYEGRRPKSVAKYEGLGVKVGKDMVRFEYSDIDGNVWNNEKLKGKVYVINVWQSECGPCRREMPVLSEWKERYPEVVFLSASRHNREEILPIVSKNKFTWTHLQEASELVGLVGQEGFPLTVVVDKKGVVRFAKVGASEENQAQAVGAIEELGREE